MRKTKYVDENSSIPGLARIPGKVDCTRKAVPNRANYDILLIGKMAAGHDSLATAIPGELGERFFRRSKIVKEPEHAVELSDTKRLAH